MNLAFNWKLFWKLIKTWLLIGVAMWIFSTIVTEATSLLGSSTLSIVSISVVCTLILVGVLGYWIHRTQNETRWIGFVVISVNIASLFSAALILFNYSPIPDAFSFFPVAVLLGWIVFFFKRQLYEVAWSILLPILTIVVLVASFIVELIIHPPSEE